MAPPQTPEAQPVSLAQTATADPRCQWVKWDLSSPDEIAERVSAFEPVDKDAGHAATRWLHEEARSDVFTVTYLLVSPERVEGFITCRVSEATLTWSGIEQLGGNIKTRKTVPAYLLCWCAKHREASVDGEELLLNAVRLGRELRRYGCAVLALDPHDHESSEKVWQHKHGFRLGENSAEPDKPARLWLPLEAA
jgi:hypothetical protein